MSHAHVGMSSDRLRISGAFGEMDVDRRDIIRFPDGLPGFEQSRAFVLLTSEANAPLQYLHAVEGPSASFLAIDPKLVHKERYSDAIAMPRPSTGSWSAYPFPSPIILYQPGQGYVRFDQAKAEAYLRGVMEKMTSLVEDTIAKWDKMGL